MSAVALLAISGVFGVLAQRTRSGAFVYPAALGVLIALTNLNAAYVADESGLGLALLLEGAALIVVGVLAERARRLLVRDGSEAEAPPPATSAMTTG